MMPWCHALAFVLMMTACGSAKSPRLPELPGQSVSAASTSRSGDAVAGRLRFVDRTLGRSGLACADCHALTSRLRGDRDVDGRLHVGPALGQSERAVWSGAQVTLEAALTACVERWLLRAPLPSETAADLLASLREEPGIERIRGPTRSALAPHGLALYDSACRSCHEGGPGGPILGRAYRPIEVSSIIRGSNRPRHPGTLMPAFSSQVLQDAEVAAIAEAIADAVGK